ncbi:DNA polymerase III subunit delta [Psychromonas sp. Urea-02u-13]|uniref:DNA polymerase III subunit delta n=1 Tax=Psychromonas sp. Urea-02u-13 TaxID=2058326 RepID=UPI000C32B402|nr:DNA polymerase III subunit delta [Psychromonas sp. Urea-02u-13]PKG39399.1 DNA polymerase III subunit delta [Psychromonas sp. Urea-02u-13]
MRIYPEQLQQHIKQQIPNCILIFGDEALLTLEAQDLVKQVAKSQGYLEHFSFSLDGNFEKDEIYSHLQSLSLFSDKKIIGLTLTKTSKENTAFLREIAPLLNDDILLLLQGPKLNNQQLNGAWFKKLESQGLYVAANAPSAQHFPQWVFKRLKSLGLQANKEVIDFLCVHFEGNLLAAKQEFEKLALLYPKQNLTLHQVEQSITTHNHFSVFQWLDSLLAGDKFRSQRILQQLKAEGLELLILSATLSSEVQKLLKLSYQMQHTPLPQLLNQHQPKLWTSKQALMTEALSHVTTQQLEQLLMQCAQLEIDVKVENSSDSWLTLELMSTTFYR